MLALNVLIECSYWMLALNVRIECLNWMFAMNVCIDQFGWMLSLLIDCLTWLMAHLRWIIECCTRDFTSLELMFQPNVCMFKSQILVLWVNVESPHWRIREWIEGWRIEFWRCWNAIHPNRTNSSILPRRAQWIGTNYYVLWLDIAGLICRNVLM